MTLAVDRGCKALKHPTENDFKPRVNLLALMVATCVLLAFAPVPCNYDTDTIVGGWETAAADAREVS